MAGRLKWDHQLGRLEVDCNVAGAGFVEASSEFSLDEIGYLVSPNPGYWQLAVQTVDKLDSDQPLCVFQVTSFRCGGFAIGMSCNHSLLDGLSTKIFLENLASQAFDEDKPLAFIPCHDRHLLAARSPPLIKFQHPEYMKITDVPFVDPPILDFKTLKLSSSDINLLKLKAQEAADHNASTSTISMITTFNVVAALIWRSRALSSSDKDRVSTLLTSINIRPRLKPPLPSEYCGNAVLVAYASAKCKDIEQGPFLKLVEMISQGHSRMTDEYAKSTIDWLETNKGLPFGDCQVTSWLSLRLDQVKFPWGKALCCMPLVNPFTPVSCVLPDVDGVNILCAQPAEEMERFQFHFRNFLEHSS